MWDECNCAVVWKFFSIAFEIGKKSDLVQSCGHCWVFQICWHECSTFTASTFSIWNSSAGIPSPQLALFAVMLTKAHLTLYSRMSGSRWVIIPSWISGSWRPFLYSSVYSGHLFLVSSASVRSIPHNRTIALNSHASKVMLNILQARLQQYVNHELSDVQDRFRKSRRTRNQIANIRWIIEKAREFQKNIYSCFIDYAKVFDCMDHKKLWKILQDMRINTRPPDLPPEKSVCRSRSNS